ncbi:AraC family transcriptional regulator [Chitinophaga sp.]|uniref:helix-turn-helix domain-containing protein n=1 Tax=Chitinophaga sp. TaxID=1869181 RepID=UPI0031CFB16F
MIKRALKQTFTLLNVDYVKLDARWNYRNVISPYFRIYYIDAGTGEIWDASAQVRLEAGFLYIIPSFTLCNLICPDYLSQYFVQFFEESSDGISLFENNRAIMKVKATDIDILNFRRLLEINPGRGINRSDDPSVYEKNVFYKEYQELNNRQSLSVFTETHGILLQLVSRFLTQETFKHMDTGQVPAKILNIISYIQLNLNRDLSVTHLAKKANLHTDYFSRLFQQHTGERPVKYVHEKRIERAQYLMLTTRLTFTEIATQTGFDNVFYFSKIFKKITGISPGTYKKQMNTIGSG